MTPAERHKRWRDANPEKHAANLQRWREQNRDKVSAQNRRYYNKPASAARNANKNAKKYGAPGILTTADIEALDPLCPCGQTGTRLDHTVAIILGGENTPANIRWLCFDCDRAKSADDIRRHWLIRRFRPS